MNMKEDQPSGPNPEWEFNREQNIVIAKKLEILLGTETPNRAERFQNFVQQKLEDLEELEDTQRIEILKEQGLIDKEGVSNIPVEVQEGLTADDIEELTIGTTVRFSNINDKYSNITVGVALSERAIDSDFLIAEFVEGMPKDFNYPVFAIRQVTENLYDDSRAYAATIYGDLPNDVIGADGLYYQVENIHCFNFFGQGVRVENIFKIGTPEEYFGESRAIDVKQKFTKVNFVPRRGDSRVVPLTTDDYTKINKMFEHIDAGLYKA